MQIVPIKEAMFPQISRIYEQGISTGMATFETQVPDFQTWNDKYLKHSRLAIIEGEDVLGWSTLSAVSKRPVYCGVAELSIYLAKEARSRGLGQMLLEALITSSEANGIWSIQSSIFPQNTVSIKLHLKCGFRQIGYKEKIGYGDGRWQDNVLFERRSTVVGV
ncbi:GNAT family N-acetyltransferase [Jiulongibacter sediminis]|uniref:Phosphinothricin acetyltransferase n=1 Tax=Jiulongibacter sediminis TaxID=1605367 RepID=A0A0P7C7Q3_9BACT|nr:GNAT family N-acetyltransferase [Jiulongibacter sediminis]KPM48458.1 phosphinothricin acetyltransferase [Jiulongibacter sediminis]TBX24996.1 phosphinothricin acetyltransferase [Jiulongibacter sediminis]